MCGVKDILLETPKLNLNNGKKDTSDMRKEKSRDAARNRRAKESDYFQELGELIPVHGTPPHSQMSSIDKTSLIRLTVSYLRTRDLVSTDGIKPKDIKEEETGAGRLDVLNALNGFGVVLNSDHELAYVTNNVSEFIGLTAFELLGMPFADFVHPCDYNLIKNLVPSKVDKDTDETPVKVCIRVKCTITDRGRLINLKQANYKALKLEGKIRVLADREEGGLHGPMFIGLASLVSNPFTNTKPAMGVFETKHSQDFKFIDADSWLVDEGNYPMDFLQGESLFRFIHAEDTAKVAAVLAKLPEHGHVETDVYRLLVGGGGYVYVETTGSYTTPRRGSTKGTTIILRHSIITGVQDAGQIIDLVQMQKVKRSTKVSAKPAAPSAVKPRVTAVPRPSAPIKAVEEFTPLKFDQDSKDMVEVLEMLGGNTIKQEMDMIVNLMSPLGDDEFDDDYVDLLADLPVQDQSLEASCNLGGGMSPTSRSSVIVAPKLEKPEFTSVTEKLFDDALELPAAVTELPQFTVIPEKQLPAAVTELPQFTAITENLFMDIAPTVTAKSGPRQVIPVTELLFMDEPTADSKQEPATFNYDTNMYPMKDTFGKLMVEDLEKFSPFIGDECIALHKGGDDLDDKYDSMGFESFDDFEFPEEQFGFNASTEKMFQDDVDESVDDSPILGGHANIMWAGTDKDSVSCNSSMSNHSSIGSIRSGTMTPVSPIPDMRDVSPLPSPKQQEPGIISSVHRQHVVEFCPSQAPRQPNTMNVRNLIQSPQSHLEHASPLFKQESNNIATQNVIGRYQQPKDGQFFKNITTTVPCPPPEFNNSMRNGGVIVQRAPQQFSYESPRCASPRFVIKPYRNTQVIAGNRSATIRDDMVKKENLTANTLSEFNKNIPTSRAGEPPYAGVLFSQSQGVITAPAAAPRIERRSSVLRNLAVDDDEMMANMRGEKRMASPVQTIQPINKQMRMDNGYLLRTPCLQ